ncbi:MAG: D-ribose pyranase [Actinomycetia bacterium]|nr:D-ribose pyranase [Actinomycetes bacterium]
MKKLGILNKELSKVIASMGHGDYLAISDAGLSIPENVKMIDISVYKNIPRFLDVLTAVLTELKIDKVFIAKEMKVNNSQVLNKIKDLLNNIEIEEISHKKFKEKVSSVKAIVRTGEFTSYSNIILVSGVVF